MVPKTGIYKIENQVNGKLYIGKTIRGFNNRWNNHKSDLRRNKHCNSHLQSAWNKYGEDNFEFEVLIYCSQDQINFYEKHFIKELDTFHNGYNQTIGGDGLSGKDNPYWKEKIEKECEYCGKNFNVYPSKKNRAKFCSYSCKNKFICGGENSNWWKGGKVEVKCEYCNDKFKVFPYRKETSKYCSHECLGKSNIVMPEKGEKSPNNSLNKEDVIEIKSLLKNSNLTQTDIANKFNVDQTTISLIKLGKSWDHV